MIENILQHLATKAHLPAKGDRLHRMMASGEGKHINSTNYITHNVKKRGIIRAMTLEEWLSSACAEDLRQCLHVDVVDCGKRPCGGCQSCGDLAAAFAVFANDKFWIAKKKALQYLYANTIWDRVRRMLAPDVAEGGYDPLIKYSFCLFIFLQL
jgi:hypothetical protein